MNTPVASPRPCPVCASVGARRALHRQVFQDGVLGSGYTVVVCADCGAGFADGIPGQAEMDRYYAEQSKYSYDGSGGAESVYDMQRFALITDQVVPHLPSKQARILDIGCATGGLLSVFKQRGYANVLGADPSPACAGAARRLHDIEVRAATLQQLEGWTERFDLVLMVGVLEHLRDAAAAVRTVASLLKPGGSFFAAVPDVEGLAESRNAPFQQFSMEHVNFFSAQSLGRLLARERFAARQTWQNTIEWREGVTERVLAGLYLLAPTAPAGLMDRLTEPALTRYIESSIAEDAVIHAKIAELVLSRRPILVWGAGALTRRLLAATPLGQARIEAFVDSSVHLHGTRLAGRMILSPAQLTGRSEAILICSVAFEREIIRAIREQHGLANELMTLSRA